MTKQVDLNADLGEDDSAEGIERDLAILDVVSSCNIACGGHAGNSKLMRTMLLAAKEKGVAAGAHPSYPDRENFGRISMDIDIPKLAESQKKQLRKMFKLAAELDVQITHIKPHGALYNDAMDDPELAGLLAHITTKIGNGVALVGMAGSAMEAASLRSKIPFVREAFVDRKYTDEARLMPRAQDGAVLEDDADRVAQALSLALHNQVQSNSGVDIKVIAESLCLHSDSPGALASAISIRKQLESHDLTIAANHAK